MRRERRRLTGSEQVGPYTLLRLEQGGLDAGVPGQFFMLEAPGRVLPRPMSVCLADAHELSFLVDPIGPGTRAICALACGDRLHVLGPLGNGTSYSVSSLLRWRLSAVAAGAAIEPETTAQTPHEAKPTFRITASAVGSALRKDARSRQRLPRLSPAAEEMGEGPVGRAQGQARARHSDRSCACA